MWPNSTVNLGFSINPGVPLSGITFQQQLTHSDVIKNINLYYDSGYQITVSILPK